ncbi:MAG: hypothetical protein Q6363_005255 [Candidatus Njordarchaeota archaeon]
MALRVEDPRLLQVVTLFGTLGICPKDFYETNDRLSILLDEEYLPELQEIKNLFVYIRKIVKKNVDVVFFSEDIDKFCGYLFYPAKIKRVEKRNTKKGRVLVVHVDFWQKGVALGAKSYKLYRARFFIKKYFPEIESVYVQA